MSVFLLLCPSQSALPVGKHLKIGKIKCSSVLQCWCLYDLLCFGCCLSVRQQRCKYGSSHFHCLCAVLQLLMKDGWTQALPERALLCTAPLCLQPWVSHVSNTLFCLGSVCTGAAPASAPSWQDGISEAAGWRLGLGDCCRFLLHPVPVLRITAGGGSLVFRVAGCFWRREGQDCLGWIASKWNWIACQ